MLVWQCASMQAHQTVCTNTRVLYLQHTNRCTPKCAHQNVLRHTCLVPPTHTQCTPKCAQTHVSCTSNTHTHRCLMSILRQYMAPHALDDSFKITPQSGTYYIPPEGALRRSSLETHFAFYKESCSYPCMPPKSEMVKTI